MAIDTRDKRMSMLGLARAMVRLFVDPIAAIGRPGREMLEYLYAGIPLDLPATATPRTLTYLATVDTTMAYQAQVDTQIVLLAQRDTTFVYVASES